MSAAPQYNICIVDDDPHIVKSLSKLLETAGFIVSSFLSGEKFLESDLKDFRGCILLDVRMPKKDGLTVLIEALEVNPNLQIIMMSGHGDIAMAVKALGDGAKNFIEKPFKAAVMLEALDKACANFDTANKAQEYSHRAKALLTLITPRERAVLDRMAEGKPNKIIAFELGISIRTVETHRSHILSKMQVKSLAELVKLYLAATR